MPEFLSRKTIHVGEGVSRDTPKPWVYLEHDSVRWYLTQEQARAIYRKLGEALGHGTAHPCSEHIRKDEG